MNIEYIIMVKIYIRDIKKHIFNDNLINKHKIRNDQYYYLYSDTGIFKIYNEKIYKLKTDDSNVDKKIVNGVDLYFDYSKSRENEVYNIPFSSKQLFITRDVYSLRNNSKLKLNIEKNKDKLFDVYFTSDDTLDEFNLNEDLNTFLAMLN